MQEVMGSNPIISTNVAQHLDTQDAGRLFLFSISLYCPLACQAPPLSGVPSGELEMDFLAKRGGGPSGRGRMTMVNGQLPTGLQAPPLR